MRSVNCNDNAAGDPYFFFWGGGGLTAFPDSISVHIEPSHTERNPGSSVVLVLAC